jgi:predicted metalloprotease with PDZ domain
MREMWRRHGSPQIPYRVDDIEAALAAVTGDADFAHDYFQRYVWGREVPDYAALLAAAGIRLKKAAPGRASLGPARLSFARNGATVQGATLVDTPLYAAGVDRGDRIIRVGGQVVRSREDLDQALRGHRPGEAMEIVYESRGRTERARVRLEEAEGMDAAVDGSAGARADAFRAAWKEGER